MVNGKKNSLTEWPEDLKDVIDWVLRVGGKDKGSAGISKGIELQSAVEALKGFNNNIDGLGTIYVAGIFGYVTDGLKEFIGYDGTQELTGEGIGRKDPPSYTSSYNSSAQWDNDMNTPTSDKANKVALIFLGTMPILYFGLTYLFWQCSNTLHYIGWKSFKLGTTSDPLYIFMCAMGFTPTQLNGSETSEEPLKNIKEKLEKFRESCGYTYSDLKEEFETFLIEIQIIKASSPAAMADSSPSTAGPVAGTLTTFGLGGGAAAAYILNLGGAKTLVNGLLKIG
ncbi:variant erythrocyte surface antigen-1 family protein [Babesia caballi]|uniref:Variant erythrocyte surface antigen-1 family protein n=1 Tax=Babesia caballi TaxID=5871 RepID=A0AAV4LRX8_BABCB|nr:variant erythrocyte surface antigen-1 family protein [Babesia caballi]